MIMRVRHNNSMEAINRFQEMIMHATHNVSMEAIMVNIEAIKFNDMYNKFRG